MLLDLSAHLKFNKTITYFYKTEIISENTFNPLFFFFEGHKN